MNVQSPHLVLVKKGPSNSQMLITYKKAADNHCCNIVVKAVHKIIKMKLILLLLALLNGNTINAVDQTDAEHFENIFQSIKVCT